MTSDFCSIFSHLLYLTKGNEACAEHLDTDIVDGIAEDILSDNETDSEAYDSLFKLDASDQPATLSDLPSFSGWLMLNGTHKRWVIIKGSHLLWAKKERNIGDDKLGKQRRRFENWMSVLNMGSIKKLKGNSKDSFAVTIAGTTKAYIWKAASTELRDDWVIEIQEHQKRVLSMLNEQKYIIEKDSIIDKYIEKHSKKEKKHKKHSKKKRSHKH